MALLHLGNGAASVPSSILGVFLPAGSPVVHTVAFPLRESPLALMVLTRATSGPVVVDGESFLDALFASAGQG